MSSNERAPNPVVQKHAVQLIDCGSKELPTAYAAHRAIRQLGLPTPMVLIDANRLQENVDTFNAALRNVDLHYAVKANPDLRIVKLLNSASGFFDAATASEIYLLRSIGVKGEKIILSHPVKDRATVQAMVAHNVGTATVDSVDEVDKLANAYQGRMKSLKLSIRFRTESSDVQLDLNQKFGCRLADVCTIAQHAVRKGLKVVGLSFHVGTQSLTAHNYDVALEHCYFLAQQLHFQAHCSISIINIGGGFCDEEYAAQHGKDHRAILREIGYYVAEAQARGFKVVAEPGRGLLTGTGTLACQVQGINHRGAHSIVHINDGIYSTLGLHTYERRAYTVQVLQRDKTSSTLLNHTEGTLQCVIAGRTCDSLDMLGGWYEFPRNIAVDDILLVPNISAYGTSLATRFNGFEAPINVLYECRNDRFHLSWDAEDDTTSIPLPLAA